MPGKYSARDDSLMRDINSWNDGVEYIDPHAFAPYPQAAPYYPGPSGRHEPAKSSKTAKYIPSTIPEERPARSPLDARHSYQDSRARRARHHSPSPDGHGRGRNHLYDAPRHRSRERDQDRERQVPPPLRHSRPPMASSKTTPALNSTRDSHRNRRRYSPSPSPPPRPRRSKTASNAISSSSKPKPPPPSTTGRPGLKRSKTSAAASELLANPRFQKAAAAALQAGGMAALKLRQAPGSWSGQKGAQVATAALGAAALDAFKAAGKEAGAREAAGSEGDRRGPAAGGGLDLGSTIGGFIADQLANRTGGGRNSGRPRH